MPNEKLTFEALVTIEREAQDVQWGGQEHDDSHTQTDWLFYIEHQLEKADNLENYAVDFRERMVKVAALAKAAFESSERIDP